MFSPCFHFCFIRKYDLHTYNREIKDVSSNSRYILPHIFMYLFIFHSLSRLSDQGKFLQFWQSFQNYLLTKLLLLSVRVLSFKTHSISVYLTYFYYKTEKNFFSQLKDKQKMKKENEKNIYFSILNFGLRNSSSTTFVRRRSFPTIALTFSKYLQGLPFWFYRFPDGFKCLFTGSITLERVKVQTLV